MARKQVKSKVAEKVEKKQNITTPSEKSVEDIEHDLQLPSSSDEEEDIEQEELSEEESSGDEEEEEVEKEDNINGLSDEEQEEVQQQQQNKANKSGHSVNKIIKTSEATTTNTSTNNKSTKSKSGVIYIGRLPSGFQESELKTYFSQFGDVINVKLARNKNW